MSAASSTSKGADPDHAALPGLLAELRAHAGLPLERALSMPPRAYVSEAFHALEVEHLFRREWHCVGRLDEVEKPGDYLAWEIAGEPVLVVRDEAGRLRAMSNVCRHRMATLLEGAGNTRRIVCPYHAWAYDLAGKLVAAPFMGEGFETRGCALPELGLEIWQGFVYVNLDREAAPLAPRLAGLERFLANYHLDRYRSVARWEETWDSNWKCLFENFSEGYHLFRAHPTTVEPALPTRGIRCLEGGEQWHLFVQTRNPNVPYEYDRELGPLNPDLTPEQQREIPIFGLFPTQAVSVSPDRLAWLTVQPLGTDRFRVRWCMDAYPGLVADGPDGNAHAGQLKEAFDRINAEDRGIVESLRRNAASVHAVAGRLSPLERAMWEFQRYLARRLCATARQPALVTPAAQPDEATM